jgi:N-acetylneuraminic acid mutarotase
MLFHSVNVVLLVSKMGERRTALIRLLILFSLLVALSNIATVWAAENSWVLKEPMPIGSSGIAVVNDKVYSIGSTTNNEYDPVTDSWTARNPMPTSQYSFGIAAYQNKIYVIGGRSNNTETGLNQVYDPATDSWETRASMLTPRSQLEAKVVNDKIYLIGGRTGGQYSTVALNEVYDPETDTWSFGTPIPNIVWQAAAGATTGEMAPKRIYVMGGLPEKSLFGTDLNQIYDPATDTWILGTPMPVARAGLHVAVVNDVLYVMGGAPYFNLQGTWAPENYQYTPIEYIPEFRSWIILPLFLTATLFAIITKKRLFHPR